MQRETPFLNDEIYHVFNRGAHKQAIFIDQVDYDRFMLLMYVANREERVHLANLLIKYKGSTFISAYDDPDLGDPSRLVDILAYTLMPNHFHFIIMQRKEGGISTFMKKVCTGYSMYFNAKHDHSGTLFQGKFKSKHVGTGDYLRWLFAYVLLNPVGLKYGKWEEEGISDVNGAKEVLVSYKYSSLSDGKIGSARPESKIISRDTIDLLEGDVSQDIDDLLEIIKDRPL